MARRTILTMTQMLAQSKAGTLDSGNEDFAKKEQYSRTAELLGDTELQDNVPEIAAIIALNARVDELVTQSNLEITQVGAPAGLSTSIVNDTIDLSITKSATANIDYYLVFNSIDGGDYGLISVISPADMANTMSVIDNTFDQTGTIAYKVYAVKGGVYSNAATASKSFTISSLEPTDLSVTPLNTTYYIQWDKPSANSRFVGNYKVYKHAHATQGSLSRSSATLAYTGDRTNLMYTIADEDKAKFHQFWVEITVA